MKLETSMKFLEIFEISMRQTPISMKESTPQCLGFARA